MILTHEVQVFTGGRRASAFRAKVGAQHVLRHEEAEMLGVHCAACVTHGRRSFLQTGAAAAVALHGVGFVAMAHAVVLTKAVRDAMRPDEILQAMKAGNQRFRRGERQDHDYLAQQKKTAKGQYPAAVLLSCIDSRAPAETIMDLRIGDIFNCRLAGNVANEDILGSMEFACKLAGAKVVLVMGHTACGAVKGAISNAELGNLTGLLAKIKPAVQATRYSGARDANNYGFVDAVARTNVVLTISDIRSRSQVLRELESSGAIKIAGAMYDLETGVVDFFA